MLFSLFLLEINSILGICFNLYLLRKNSKFKTEYTFKTVQRNLLKIIDKSLENISFLTIVTKHIKVKNYTLELLSDLFFYELVFLTIPNNKIQVQVSPTLLRQNLQKYRR